MGLKSLPCFQHVNWAPDRAELRRFAGAMLVGFAALGGIAALKARHVGTAGWVLWSLGVALAACSQVPAVARAAYLAVYLPSSAIGFVVSQVVLTVIFALVFTPVGLLLRLTGRDLLELRKDTPPKWTRHAGPSERRRYYRQY